MRIIIDTDPGTDDAVAILIALAHFTDQEILGITTVAGNVGVKVGTKNALRILEHAGRNDIKVYEGESAPLERDLLTAEWVHGTDGLGGVPFPEPSKKEEQIDAVSFLKDSILNSEEKVTICVLREISVTGPPLQLNASPMSSSLSPSPINSEEASRSKPLCARSSDSTDGWREHSTKSPSRKDRDQERMGSERTVCRCCERAARIEAATTAASTGPRQIATIIGSCRMEMGTIIGAAPARALS